MLLTTSSFTPSFLFLFNSFVIVLQERLSSSWINKANIYTSYKSYFTYLFWECIRKVTNLSSRVFSKFRPFLLVLFLLFLNLIKVFRVGVLFQDPLLTYHGNTSSPKVGTSEIFCFKECLSSIIVLYLNESFTYIVWISVRVHTWTLGFFYPTLDCFYFLIYAPCEQYTL